MWLLFTHDLTPDMKEEKESATFLSKAACVVGFSCALVQKAEDKDCQIIEIKTFFLLSNVIIHCQIVVTLLLEYLYLAMLHHHSAPAIIYTPLTAFNAQSGPSQNHQQLVKFWSISTTRSLCLICHKNDLCL